MAANVEGALIDAVDDGSRGVFFHAMNPAATKVLKDMHADIWCVGNNHTMDAGKEGVISTRRIAREMGCLTIGAGLNEAEASEPIYLDEAGGIGMFGVAYMAECIPATATEPGIFRWDDMDYIKRRIDEVKAKCRWCVIVSHGGEEWWPIIPTCRRTMSSSPTGRPSSTPWATSSSTPTTSGPTCIRTWACC